MFFSFSQNQKKDSCFFLLTDDRKNAKVGETEKWKSLFWTLNYQKKDEFFFHQRMTEKTPRLANWKKENRYSELWPILKRMSFSSSTDDRKIAKVGELKKRKSLFWPLTDLKKDEFFFINGWQKKRQGWPNWKMKIVILNFDRS